MVYEVYPAKTVVISKAEDLLKLGELRMERERERERERWRERQRDIERWRERGEREIDRQRERPSIR